MKTFMENVPTARPVPSKHSSGSSKISRRKWIDRAEQGGLALVAIASITIGLLDFLGFLDGTFLEERIGAMNLIIIGILAGYIIVERLGALQRLAESIRELNATSQKLPNRLAPLEQAASRISAIFEGLSSDRFSELKLLYGVRGYNNAVTKDQINAGKDQVFELWTDSLREATSFCAFNYVSPDEVWGTKGWAFNIAHSMQVARLQLGCTIKRVFVLDDAAEYNRMKELMVTQATAGMEVKWILRSEMTKEPLTVQYLQSLGTWDFVVVDNDLLFRVNIDDQRRMQSCSLARDRDLFQKAQHVFREALHMGHDHLTPPASH
jgi:hypothetical protein